MIQSVRRALELLEHIGAHPEGVRLSRLASDAGLNRSTTHNLLATLEDMGYVCQEKKGAAYRLGPKLQQLQQTEAEAEFRLRSAIAPVLARLVQISGESAFLALLSGQEYVCVDAVQSEQPLHLAIKTGERKGLLGDALGHALLAADPDLSRHVSAEDPSGWAAHREEIAQTGRDGFALDLDRESAGISCVAVAIGRRAAVAVAGPTFRLDRSRLISIAASIRQELSGLQSG